MDDKEIKQGKEYFGLMVDSAEKIITPYKAIVKWLIIALIVTNVIWAVIVAFLLFIPVQEVTVSGGESPAYYQEGEGVNNIGDGDIYGETSKGE